MKKNRESQKDIAYQIKKLMKILIPFLGIYIVFCGVIITNISKQTVANIGTVSDLYISELDNKFFRISRRLLWNIMDNQYSDSLFQLNIKQVKDSVNEQLELNIAILNLQEDFLQYSWEYGQEYHFFLYIKSLDKFVILDIANRNKQEKIIEQKLIEEIEHIDRKTYSVKKKWDSLYVKDKNYIFKIVQRQDLYLGCYVNVEDILNNFNTVVNEHNCYIELRNENDQRIGEVGSPEKIDNIAIIREMQRAPFSIHIYISNQKLIGILFIVVASLIILGMLMLGMGLGMVMYLRKYVMRPIQKFVEGLMQYEENEPMYDLSHHNFLELEQMDHQFKRMMRQIRKLKITIYEKELEKNKIEMDYLKLQIRPHFYLNCLNFIYSMIEFEEYNNAKKMAFITSNYLQYIFKNGLEKLPIIEEIEHCKNYLDILLLRYSNQFEYYIECHEEVKKCSIFPFLIQVFVENASKYALDLEKRILISITAYPEEREEGEYINIYISDTGRGFPDDVLEKIQKGEVVYDGKGKHVGIYNCLKRFQYFYGNRGEINFSNSPLGGAIVDIHIPKEFTE